MEEAVGLTLGVLQLGGGEACMVGACRVRSCVTSGSRRLRAYSSETMKPVVLKKTSEAGGAKHASGLGGQAGAVDGRGLRRENGPSRVLSQRTAQIPKHASASTHVA